LVAEVTGRLFDLGVNLGAASFSVLGKGAEFTAICELPDELSHEEIDGELRLLPELRDAAITIAPFGLDPVHGPSGKITHRILVSGGDRPGLIARLCEVFVQFKANIVRLNSEKIPGEGDPLYSIGVSVWIPEGNENSCLATIANTAGELGLECRWEAAEGGR
ncbi:MAG: amino acid-binding protein, partial [Rhodospirillales bacterium]|nr:amino acid-binding protein [Rhodospirillales bacterium]